MGGTPIAGWSLGYPMDSWIANPHIINVPVQGSIQPRLIYQGCHWLQSLFLVDLVPVLLIIASRSESLSTGISIPILESTLFKTYRTYLKPPVHWWSFPSAKNDYVTLFHIDSYILLSSIISYICNHKYNYNYKNNIYTRIYLRLIMIQWHVCVYIYNALASSRDWPFPLLPSCHNGSPGS